MSRISQQRRRFLKALGVGATALPFFQLLQSSAVHGAGVARPMRLLALCTGFGGHWGYLRPPGVVAGAGEVALTPELLTYENSVLEPLKDFASQMLVLEGIARTTGLMPYAARANNERTYYSGHDGYAPSAYTGAPVLEQPSGNVPTGPSIDFVLGEQLGNGTAVRSLQLGIGSVRGIPDQVNLSYNGSGAAQPAIEDPAAFFRQMFGSAGAPPSGGPMVDESAAIRRAQDLSIVGALHGSAKRLSGRLAGIEKAKLDDHLAALADIENRLKGQNPNGTVNYPPVVCDSPTMPAEGTTGTLQEVTDLHFDVLTQAFACDRTRFVMADWGIDRGTVEVLPDVKDLHGEVAHQLEESGGDPANNIPPTTKAMTDLAKLNMGKLQRWYAQQLANLMTRMAQTPDGDGSLLDNTLIIWSSDFGENVHGGLNVPHILLGGARRKFRMGRYLNFAPTAAHPATNGDIAGYQPHNRLLVSVLQAFGLDVDQFGSDEYTGTLPNLT
ncbi:MAG TPA: DUF1552 domain-containing protein [Polyangiaceae bacterium]|nr:DUF1552 domain-containing protein [Polyangiaceae bacterium]